MAPSSVLEHVWPDAVASRSAVLCTDDKPGSDIPFLGADAGATTWCNLARDHLRASRRHPRRGPGRRRRAARPRSGRRTSRWPCACSRGRPRGLRGRLRRRPHHRRPRRRPPVEAGRPPGRAGPPSHATSRACGRPADRPAPSSPGSCPPCVATNSPWTPSTGWSRANLRRPAGHRLRELRGLLGYCDLSAGPIGELVLHLFAGRPGRGSRCPTGSAPRCRSLEHLQDVAEDRRRGRVYLPAEDLAAPRRQGGRPRRTGRPPALRALIAAQADRVAGLLDSGPPLVAGLARLGPAGRRRVRRRRPGRLDALAGVDGDVLARLARGAPPGPAAHVAGCCSPR